MDSVGTRTGSNTYNGSGDCVLTALEDVARSTADRTVPSNTGIILSFICKEFRFSFADNRFFPFGYRFLVSFYILLLYIRAIILVLLFVSFWQGLCSCSDFLYLLVGWFLLLHRVSALISSCRWQEPTSFVLLLTRLVGWVQKHRVSLHRVSLRCVALRSVVAQCGD